MCSIMTLIMFYPMNDLVDLIATGRILKNTLERLVLELCVILLFRRIWLCRIHF